eukprot:7104760-Ditylum_brightwellii.AAC.1
MNNGKLKTDDINKQITFLQDLMLSNSSTKEVLQVEGRKFNIDQYIGHCPLEAACWLKAQKPNAV